MGGKTCDNVYRLTSVDGVLYNWDKDGNLHSDCVNTHKFTEGEETGLVRDQRLEMSPSPRIKIQRKWIFACITCLFAGLIIGFAWEPLSKMIVLFGDQAAVSTVVRSYGFWGPLVIILLHSLHNIIAAIPGYMIIIASGYIYSFWGGFTLTLITTVVLSQATFPSPAGQADRWLNTLSQRIRSNDGTVWQIIMGLSFL